MNQIATLLSVGAVLCYIVVHNLRDSKSTEPRSIRSIQTSDEYATSSTNISCMESEELIRSHALCDIDLLKVMAKRNRDNYSGKQKCDALLKYTKCVYNETTRTCGKTDALKFLRFPGTISINEEYCECCSELWYYLNDIGSALYISSTTRTCEVHDKENAATCVKCVAYPALNMCDTGASLYELARVYCHHWTLGELCFSTESIRHYMTHVFEPTGNPAVTIEQCPEFYTYIDFLSGNSSISMTVTFNFTKLHSYRR
ncbi:hypothetical protein DdX_18004 [Ditylenchus destructor]|uniref:Uncharacterized protein n=1 Tax=Ditylenchus destructor TaxID=166010 RepID=A0AAD4QVA6_9BILA|nr:hypothetical protein DdX_18004 [Ditylenchus destructor]